MGNTQPGVEASTNRMGSTMDIPLLRSFFGETPPTPRNNHVGMQLNSR